MPAFLKRYCDADRAAEAYRRTLALRQQGLPTPAAKPGPEKATLLFERIEGPTGRALIGASLSPVLEVVMRLHMATVSDLPSYDPLLRIRPRLAPTDDPLFRAMAEGPVPQGRALLHGDLHLGQFILDPSGKVWLLDLDDLALGPPEADLANFAAHLATTEPAPGIAGWVEQVCGEWTSLGGRVDAAAFTRFLHLALVRRHLKLREARRPDFGPEIHAYLRDRASFSMR